MSLPNAFITLLTTSSYLPGALVLLHSLLELHPEPRDFKTVCLVTPETVDAKTIGEVRKAGFDLVIGVEPIGSGIQGEEGLKLMGRPDLNLALTKLHLFRLSSLFSTLIYLDADVLPLRSLSHLFDTTEPHILSACPDIGWPDCFNSGVMVIRPRDSDWEGLRKLLKNGEGQEGIYLEGQEGLYGNGSFDGADQGLLNEWFSEEGGGGQWNRLPFLYNVTPTAAYQYEPTYRRYGHKVNAVHFIGPNKPWTNMNSRPAGLSIAQGQERKFDYPSLIDRWYDVYDRYVRPTAAHHPDQAQRFAVPETVSVWNTPSATAGQPHDRLDLDQLRNAVGVGMTALRPGQYTSLPLDGRVDLIMPKPRAPPTATYSPPKSPSVAMATTSSSPPVVNAPLPQSFAQQTQQPATWDAQHFAPPVGSGPEMTIPMNTYYTPAWEASAAQQSSYYSGQVRQPEPQYPTLPESVLRNNWYHQYAGSSPDRSHIQPVFPWEQPGHAHRRPDRVFPRGSPPPPGSFQAPEPSITVHQPSPEKEHQESFHGLPNSPPRSMADAMASYSNAWDRVPSIQRYVEKVTRRPKPSMSKEEMPKGFDVSTLKSVPTTPMWEASRRLREGSVDRRSEASGDGDDEDEGESEDKTDPGSSPSLGSSQHGAFPREEFPPQPPYPTNEKYRDRHSQTDRIKVSDQKIQVIPGGGPSPAMKTVDLPRESRGGAQPVQRGSRTPSHQSQHAHHSSSSESTPRANLMTPPSDNSPSHVPFPPNPAIARQAGDNGSESHGGPTVGALGLYGERRSSSNTSDAGRTDSGGTPEVRASRRFDPSTDVDARKKETQQVLNRFIHAGAFAQGGGATKDGKPV